MKTGRDVSITQWVMVLVAILVCLPVLVVARVEINVDQQLVQAAMRSNFRLAKDALAKGADVNAKDNIRARPNRLSGLTALMWASRHGHTPVVKLLLERGADVNIRGSGVSSALKYAADTGHADVVKLLLDAGAEVPSEDSQWALENAAARGYIKVAKILLDRGATYDLGTAVRVGDLERVRRLLKSGVNIHDRQSISRNTALAWAAEQGQLKIVRLLAENGATYNLKLASLAGDVEGVPRFLQAGVDVNAKGKHGFTALMAASSKGRIAVARQLLGKGADANAKTDDGHTALMSAAGSGSTEVVKLLLDRGAEIDAKTDTGSTALIAAASNGRISVAKLLIDRGAHVNAGIEIGQTALTEADSHSHFDIVKLLIARGATYNLHIAARAGDLRAVQRLLDGGALVDETDKNGRTALMKAADAGRSNIAKLLLDKSANVNAKDEHGLTALMLGAQSGHADVLRILPVRGADLNARFKGYPTSASSWNAMFRWTALMMAAKSGHDDAVKALLDAGADAFAKGKLGAFALGIAIAKDHTKVAKLILEKADRESLAKIADRTLLFAAWEGNEEVARMLLEKGADVNATGSNAETALVVAANQGHADVVKLLRTYGAKE